jgi:hypothetical protein
MAEINTYLPGTAHQLMKIAGKTGNSNMQRISVARSAGVSGARDNGSIPCGNYYIASGGSTPSRGSVMGVHDTCMVQGHNSQPRTN